MNDATPRVDPSELSHNSASVFRLVARVTAQPTETSLVLSAPTHSGRDAGPVTLDGVRTTAGAGPFVVDKWYEFVCRASDAGDVGFLVLDAVECVLHEGESVSVDAVVALQGLSKQFPEIY
ncbi:Rfa3p KNAG_0C02370 [Huiozyma naganishii CBS 8797]|uniref:Replication factor A protein 3 n=1 Tax=Huiozyma naganishii (strain ATCC MYA-139 / BCRC 22969 / CBS 8797 / KCTC 17520 / NBRC 10181 / NCYC 3082 / Yp74L-3) TaxID=1071383 RepID=J7RIJ4_HUIN7|nr:hypothetical protein KNAG_0C02370 [Kazachstania naganishii CBS 8797]CCK69348.1 hypothetical protein KNAG_0C02370 [Kazachstania naganishii CBS 8797]